MFIHCYTIIELSYKQDLEFLKVKNLKSGFLKINTIKNKVKEKLITDKFFFN